VLTLSTERSSSRRRLGNRSWMPGGGGRMSMGEGRLGRVGGSRGLSLTDFSFTRDVLYR
jgi:hypothetical protein